MLEARSVDDIGRTGHQGIQHFLEVELRVIFQVAILDEDEIAGGLGDADAQSRPLTEIEDE